MFSPGVRRRRDDGKYEIQGPGRGELETGCTSMELQRSLTFSSHFQHKHL